MLTEKEFAEWYARVNMSIGGQQGAIAAATKRIGELEATLEALGERVGGHQQMHNLLLQLQQRVRAISFKVGLGTEVTVPLEVGAPKAPNSTEDDGRPAWDGTSRGHHAIVREIEDHWRGKFAAMRGEFEQQMQELRTERDMALGEVASLKEERHILQGKLEVCEKEREAALKEARVFYYHASGDASGLQPGDVEPLTDAQRVVIVGENKDGN